MAYKFHDFKDLAKGDGFSYPVDVSYDSTYIGTLIAEPDGFVIKMVDTPKGKALVNPSRHNKFKSKSIATDVLHKLWKIERQGEKPTFTESKNITAKQLKKLIMTVLKTIKESDEPTMGGPSAASAQTVVGGTRDVNQLERDPLLDPIFTGKTPFKK